jgi:hypothetical protein
MDVLDLQNEYNTKFELLSNRISNYQYIFEITKLCGHGEFLTIHKKQTLLDLYKIVSLFYECKDIKQLFFINNCTNERIKIPITEEITISQFISSHNSDSNLIIKPIYPVPCKIVYRIYFDDGHTHGDKACELTTFT